MDAVSAKESILRETFDVAGVARSFKPVQEQDLAPGFGFRLMLYDHDACRIGDFIDTPRAREALDVDFTRPKVTGNGCQMRIAEDGPETSMHNLF
jgi:hypothetical protein